MPNYAQAAIQLRHKKEKAEKEKLERMGENQVVKGQKIGGKNARKGHTKLIPPFPKFPPYIGAHGYRTPQVNPRNQNIKLLKSG